MILREVNAEIVRNHPMWFVDLLHPDGKTERIYQWDFTEDGGFVNSWLELKQYVNQNNLKITDMFLGFRDHIEHIGSGAAGYFMVFVVFADSLSGIQEHYYVCGTYDGEYIHTMKWKIPEIIFFEPGIRKPEEGFNESALIRNPT